MRHGQECWIRLNKADGKFDCIKTNPSLWTYSESSDLAAIKLPLVEIGKYDIAAIPSRMFLTKEMLIPLGIGVGDETFVVGRFVNHEGKQKNKPTARFGTIAMMPDEKDGIYNEHLGKEVEAYLVETHTIGGYSGAPVALHIPPLSNRPGDAKPSWTWRGHWLLGVDFCHLVTYDDIYEPRKGGLVKTEYKAQTSTGMLAVVPAWELLTLLNEQHFVDEREAINSEWEKLNSADRRMGQRAGAHKQK